MNRYRHAFLRTCPSNGRSIRYSLLVETTDTVMVEDLVSACAGEAIYHEALADELHGRFGGRQIMRAHHHGVWIETQRGEAEDLP